MRIITIIAIIVTVALSIAIWTEHREKLRYRDAALKNGRAAIQKGKELREMDGQINRRAAHKIAEQNAVIEELEGEIRRLRNINRNLLKQMDRREE